MARYKLYYFHTRGRAEATRMMFHLGGIEYEDIRVTQEEWISKYKQGRAEATRMLFHLGGIEYEDIRFTKDEWISKYKQEMPCHHAPVLFIDGEPLTQSRTIARYVARESGFGGSTNLERGRIEAIMDTCPDYPALFKWFKTDDPKEQEHLVKVLREEETPPVLTNLETLLKQNNGGDGFFVGVKMTVADIYVFCEVELCKAFVPDLLEPYPKLSALFARVAADEKVAEWMTKRPNTRF